MSVFSKVEGVIGARVGGLEIAGEGIHGKELFRFDAGRAAAWNDSFLRGAMCSCGVKAPQTVQYHLRSSRQRRLRLLGNCFLGDFPFLQAELQRMPPPRQAHQMSLLNLVAAQVNLR